MKRVSARSATCVLAKPSSHGTPLQVSYKTSVSFFVRSWTTVDVDLDNEYDEKKPKNETSGNILVLSNTFDILRSPFDGFWCIIGTF